MKHSDECPCKPWNEWLIETGAEDVDEEEEEAPVTTDGEFSSPKKSKSFPCVWLMQSFRFWLRRH